MLLPSSFAALVDQCIACERVLILRKAHKHCAPLRNAILEHASPVLGSGLSKIGQAGGLKL